MNFNYKLNSNSKEYDFGAIRDIFARDIFAILSCFFNHKERNASNV